MTDLIARLQEAERGSREMDALVWCAAFPAYRYHSATQSTGAAIYRNDGSRVGIGDLGRYTTSLDAIVSLIGEKLPGRMWSIGHLPTSDDADHEEHHNFGCLIYSFGHIGDKGDAMEHGATPALAAASALLRALEGQDDHG